MAAPSSTTTVVRYTALIGGILYGLVHQGTLQTRYDESQVQKATARRAHLIEEAKKAYAAKIVADKEGGAAKVITNIDDPKFDLERLIEYYAKSP